MNRYCLVLLALAAAALRAQESPAPQGQEPPKPETSSIEGRVINGVSGEGVKKAEVVIFGKDNKRYTTTTESGGEFVMRDLEPGRYHLHVAKRGYGRLVFGARGSGRPGVMLSLDPGQQVSGLVLPMSPQAVITGRIVDEDGDPQPFISVQLLRYAFVHGKKRLQPFDSGETNDLGEYRLFDLSPGKYYLSATSEGWRGETNDSERFAPTFYPGTVNPAGATPIELKPGSLARGVDITLTRVRTVRVRGRVVDPNAKQTGQGSTLQQSVNVEIEPREESSTWRSFGSYSMDAQGNFEFYGVAPGAYFVEAFKREQGSRQYVARQAVDIGQSDIQNVLLELSPEAELKGQLHFEGSWPASVGDAQISLRSQEASNWGWSGGPVKADGSFSIPNIVTATRYELSVDGLPDGYYVKSARLGDSDILNDGVEFTGGVTGQLQLVASSSGGEVEGVVLNADDQPAQGAVVELVPKEPLRARSRLYKQASTDQYGRFLIKGIAPGGYKLFAWEDIIEGQYEDPEFMKSCEALGQPVTIRERSHASAQLKLIPAETAGKTTTN